MSRLLPIVGILGGLLLIFGGGDGPSPFVPPSADVLSQCHEADRASKIALLAEMESKEFDSDQKQLEWWNSNVSEAFARDFQPFVNELAAAIENGTIAEFRKGLVK